MATILLTFIPATVLIVFSFVNAIPNREVYFSDMDSIQVFSNNTISVVFTDPNIVDTLDCNSNPADNKIYWIDRSTEGTSRAMIKRGIPNNPLSVETVISRDLSDPQGLAVDWSSNNIYFSQRRVGSGNGRVEVASSDGRKRKVLLHNLQRPGPLAVNVATGYLYFTEYIGGIYPGIFRCYLDGSNRDTVFSTDQIQPITGLSIDNVRNIIYWTQGSELKSLNIWEFENSTSNVFNIITVESLYKVSAFNNSLYWTVSRQYTRPGGLYYVDAIPSGNETISLNQAILVESIDLNPRGICTFYNLTAMSSPCSDSRNECEEDAFCFVVPDGNGGTLGRCSCPTGLILNPNNISCPSVPQNFLLYSHVFPSVEFRRTDRTELRMITLDEGPFIDVQLPIDIHSTTAVYVTFDQLQHKVYWTEWDPPSIMRANLDGTNVEVFINSSISQPQSLAIDPYSGNLYWADSMLRRISVARINNPKIRKVLFTNIYQPQGLALDIARGYLYWSDLDPSMPVVEEARMNGQGRKTIPEQYNYNMQTPTNVAVDRETSNLYWIELKSSMSAIMRYSDGTQPVDLHITGIRDGFGLAVNGDFIYWTDRGSSSRPLGRSHLLGGSPENVLMGVDGLHGLVAINTNAENINTGCHSTSDVQGKCSDLCLPSGNATYPSCACRDFHVLDERGGCRDTLSLVLMFNQTFVSNLDISLPSHWHLGNYTWPLTRQMSVGSVDGHLRSNTVYWIDTVKKVILRRRIDNIIHGEETVISCCLTEPEDLAVDWLGHNLYWTDSGRRVIEFSQLNGTLRSVLTFIPINLGPPQHIALDPFGGDIYWSSKTEPKIYRTKMNGSQSHHTLFRQFTSSSASIFGLSLEFDDESESRLFWGVNVSNLSDPYKVMSSNLLDSDITQQHNVISQESAEKIFGFQVFNHSIYLNSENTRRNNRFINKVDENGDSNRVFNRPDVSFSEFIILHHTIQPEVHMCEFHECDGNALCLVSNGVSGTCQCSPLHVLKTSTNQKPACVATKSFLVLATEDNIHYLPVPRVALLSKGTVRPLPIVPEGRVVDLAFDPKNNSVIWIEEGSRSLHSVKVNSKSEWEIPIATEMELHPFSLAFDWKGGNIVFTETDGFELKHVSADGNGRGSLLDFEFKPRSRLEKTGEVVFDSDSSILYWTNLDGLSNLGRELNFFHLSNLSNITSIPLGGRKIKSLTFEPESHSLYWISRYLVEREEEEVVEYAIERCNLNNNYEIIRVASNARDVDVIAASSVQESLDLNMSPVPYIYWYNQSDRYLYRSYVDGPRVNDTNEEKRYIRWTTPDRVVSIIGYRKKQIPSTSCRAEERPCSHICIPGRLSSEYTCVCPPAHVLNNSNGNCMEPSCSPLQLPCGNDFGSCFPGVYYCDGIRHCDNGFDEMCTCDLSTENGCYDEEDTGRITCYAHEERCDGTPQCSNGFDETRCCGDTEFGCYINDSTREGMSVYFCLDLQNICDGTVDCADGRDEIECSTMTTTFITLSDGQTTIAMKVTIIIAVAIVSVIIIVVAIVIITFVFSVVWKRRDEYRVGHGHHSISYTTHSPQLRTESRSDYSSEFSHGTNTTQVGNGSTALSPSGDKTTSNLDGHAHLMNPPPSPISTIHPRHSLALSEDDGMSTFSQAYSEDAAPPPPCPSLNYDNVSGNMSFSVSQTNFHATINGYPSNNTAYHSHHHCPQRCQGGFNATPGSGRPPGRNPNPLLARNTPRMQLINRSGIPYQTRGQNSAAPTNQTSNFSHGYYLNHSNQSHSYPHIMELDSITQTDETGSTLSIVTENPDVFPYDTSMPHPPPPGRPPSPATVYSEYPDVPLSPGSSVSFNSQL